MNVKLEGVRIWLAASVQDAPEEDQNQTLAFVEAFAKAVFLLGDRYLRIDCASNVKELDNTKAIDQLAGLGEDEAKRFVGEVMTRFLNGVPADDWKTAANPKP